MRDFETKNVYGCLYVFSMHVVSEKLYPLFFPSNVQLNETAKVFAGIWKSRKRKWNKIRTNHWCNVYFIACFVITLVFYLEMVIWLDFMSHVLCLYSCTVLCDSITISHSLLLVVVFFDS